MDNLLKKIEACYQDGHYTHDALVYLPQIMTALLMQKAEIEKLKTMSLDEFCLWKTGTTPVKPEKEGDK